MSGPRVLFLPDYGTAVGGGHVMRCLTLAEELGRRGAACGFAVLPEAAQVIERFGGGVQIVGEDWDAEIAVVDGYDYDLADEQALGARGLKVAAFDDLKRPHDCDLVIDYGLGRLESDYPGRARVLTGSSFAPIRPEFTAVRQASLERRAREFGGQVLVSLGLTDVGGVTARLLERIMTQRGWSAIDVVLGAGAQSLPHVRALAARDDRIALHVDSRDMAGLCAAADIAVGAGGGSQWERACVGLPTLLVILAPNQAPTARQLAEFGAALAVDVGGPLFESLFDASLQRLLADEDLRAAITARSTMICDGEGAGRIAEAVLALV